MWNPKTAPYLLYISMSEWVLHTTFAVQKYIFWGATPFLLVDESYNDKVLIIHRLHFLMASYPSPGLGLNLLKQTWPLHTVIVN